MKKILNMRIARINKKNNQSGFTLIELVVVITLLGVTLPAVYSLYGSLSVHSVKSAVYDQMVAYGQDKMEEIIAIKEKNWDWYKDPAQFEVDEDLADDYHRKVTVTTFSNWGNSLVDGWEVKVEITHPMVDSPYELVTRFTKYHE
jgi:prepilin-type N-terminal cleavage/methylation domain-containing protein